jgi:hypothetical protein
MLASLTDNNLQHHKHSKLGRMHKPSTPTTPFIQGDEVIGKLYQKSWSLSLSPLTPGHDLVQCYRHSSPPPTIPTKNPGTPHTPTTNITNPIPTSCTNLLPNYHAHLGFSHLLTSDGRNLPRASPTRRTFFGNSYLDTPHRNQVYIRSSFPPWFTYIHTK